MTLTAQNSPNPLPETFTAARKVSVPLMVVRTTDPNATYAALAMLLPTLKPANVNKCLFTWDACNGLTARNDAAVAVLGQITGGGAGLIGTINPVTALSTLAAAPEQSCTIFYNAHLFWNDPTLKQAIWNLREAYKTDHRTLVLLAPRGVTAPAELVNDVIVVDEPLPTPDMLDRIMRDVYNDVGAPINEATIAKAVEALAGTKSAFLAEQYAAMSITKHGVNLDRLWAFKKTEINGTHGLRWIDPTMNYATYGGNAAAKEFFGHIFNGKVPPTAIIVLDEINDALGGIKGDNTGVSQAIHKALLTSMAERKYEGAMLLGHPGVGKSAICHAAAGEFNVPLLELDLGGIKASHVGESEERMAVALEVIDALSGGRPLFVGTCNGTDNISAQLMSRFPFRFFFDLPDASERKTIWPIYEQHPHDGADPLTAAQLKDRPDDKLWTGREIMYCCRYAYKLNLTLKQAARYVVPTAKSEPEEIDRRRKFAAGRYLSANYDGEYQIKNEKPVVVTTEPVKGRLPRGFADMPES
jgi:hypothetical protein